MNKDRQEKKNTPHIAIEYLLLIFFITILWIYSYRVILHFLNTHFHQRISDSFLIPGVVSPEPFEIPVYILLTVLFSFVCFFFLRHRWFVLKKFNSFHMPHANLFRWAILAGLIWIFYMQLGEFPYVQEMRAYSFISPFIDALSKLVAFGYILALFIFTFLIVKVAYKTRKKRGIFLYLLIITIAALFTFEPGFPIFYFDYSQFFGPILEVVNGKTLYTETNSHYGFLLILILSAFVKIRIFDITYLPFVVWVLYIFQYTLCFYLVYKVSRSALLASLAIFSIITINYYSLIHMPIGVPQSGPMRWLVMLLVLLLVYKLRNFRSTVIILSISVLSLMVIDAGIGLICAYLLTLALLALKRELQWREVGKTVLRVFLYIIFLFMIINSFLIVIGYKSIQPNIIFSKLHQYSQQGFNMIAIPSHTYFWITVLIYFSSLLYFFRKKTTDFVNQHILFSANLSLFASIYYVGRSHITNLVSLSILPLLSLFLLIAKVFSEIRFKFMKIAIYMILFILFIFIPAFNRRVSLSYIVYEKINRLGIKLYENKLPMRIVYLFCKPQKIHVIDTEMRECVEQKYSDDAVFINRTIPDDEIVILSPDDTYLFYLTGKKNMLRFNPQANINTKEELDFALQKAIDLCPRKIVVDPRVIGKGKEVKTLNYFYSIQPNLFDELQNACKIRYVKSSCSSDICIATVK